MNAPLVSSTMLRSLTATILLSAAAAALAAEPPAAQSAPSREMREKMAAIHQDMATCLRSDKPFAECQQQMHKSCADMMGEQGCPMGMGPHKRGMTPRQEK